MLKKADHKRRKVSEIYFVLYLAALIMLLPGKNEKKGNNIVDAIIAAFQQSFSLLPEKHTLLCRLTTDSAGMKTIECDTANILLLTGNVTNVSLECSVEDLDLHEIIQVDNSIGQRFSVKYDSLKKLVFFSWHPPQSLFENPHPSRSFLVTVRALAQPDIGNNSSMKKLVEGLGAVLRTEAKFSISILAEGSGKDDKPTIIFMPAETTYQRITVVDPAQNSKLAEGANIGQAQVYSSTFSMQPLTSHLKTFAFQPWTNKILVNGVLNSSDYSKMPVIRLERQSNDGSGSAEIAEIKLSEIIIKGSAPFNNSMKVIVTAQRKSDNKELSTEFYIQTQSLNQPQFPRSMFPGIKYLFIPQLPLITGNDVRAVLRNGKTEIVVSMQGLPFEYVPEISDTGQTLVFERQLNGKVLGQSYSIKIESFASPEIIGETNINGVITIKTRTFGSKNGKDNRGSLVMKEGTSANCQVPRELYGNFQADRNGLIFIQVFELKPRDPSKQMKCIVKVIDQFGKYSSDKYISTE